MEDHLKFIIILFFLCSLLYADDELKKYCLEKVEKADSVRAIEGRDGWLFPFEEFKHLSKEEQFSAQAIDEIIEYRKALSKEGVSLLIVPLPPKSVFYDDKLLGKSTGWNPYLSFHKLLKIKNVQSLDLVPLFYEMKEKDQLFCKRDSHFSPIMSKFIAQKIAQATGMKPEGKKYAFEEVEVKFEGDLTRQSDKTFEKESFKIKLLKNNGVFPEVNLASPVLLMGDSNCLVYSSGGDMHVRGAGVFEYLSQSLGQGIDLLAVKGSGIDKARVDFFRRSMDINYLRKKKLVIWLFAAYELTESRGWKKIPVRR